MIQLSVLRIKNVISLTRHRNPLPNSLHLIQDILVGSLLVLLKVGSWMIGLKSTVRTTYASDGTKRWYSFESTGWIKI